MSWLAENGIPAIGDKDFDDLGYDGIISAKSLYWLAQSHEDNHGWSLKAEDRLVGASVSNIAKDFVETHWFPRLAFRDHRSGNRTKSLFDGAHNPVNDAALTLLNAIGCAIDYAAREGINDRDGNPMTWDSVPPVTATSPWHIAAVDAEGANLLGKVLSEWGTVHLHSVDVENIPYKLWHTKFKCSMIADKRYINTRNPFCPRPHPRYLWFKNQTVTRILDKKDMSSAIMDEFSATGYTRRHYHLSPVNVRVQETAPELSTVGTTCVEPEPTLSEACVERYWQQKT